MAERKYDKYFYSYERSREVMESESHNPIVWLDDSVIKGCNTYYGGFFLPGQEFSNPKNYAWWSGHPPHIHREAEILFHIGTNPEDPSELGAEVVIYMGPELERHVINRSTVVYIPPNFIHCPWNVARTWKPWIHLEFHQSALPSEKGYWQILPEDIVPKISKEEFPDRRY